MREAFVVLIMHQEWLMDPEVRLCYVHTAVSSGFIVSKA